MKESEIAGKKLLTMNQRMADPTEPTVGAFDLAAPLVASPLMVTLASSKVAIG